MDFRSVARAERDHELAYIDALRGYAILAVIAVHSGAGVPDLSGPLRLVIDQGARGVQLFFVVSALTLTLSWHERADGILPFLVRRVFRIGPMFWLAMLWVIGTEAYGLRVTGYAPATVSWFTVLTTATLTHGFHPQTINSIVPGGWSIADEMMFYVLLPLLIATLRSWMAVALALVAAVGLSLLAALLFHWGWLFPELDRGLVGQFAVQSFPNQFPAFLAGMLLFHLLRAFPQRLPPSALGALLAAALVIMVMIPFAVQALLAYMPYALYFMPMVYTAPLALLTWCFAKGGGGFLINRATRSVGKISYSAYFWHFPVIWQLASLGPLPFDAPAWLRYLILYAGAVALSSIGAFVTYRLVEQPMIKVGRQLAKRLAAAGATATQPAGSVGEAI